MNKIKEVLKELSRKANTTQITSAGKWVNQDIDSALTSIAEIVEAEKKEHREGCAFLGTPYGDYCSCDIGIWNACCDHIIKLIKGELTEAEGKGG